MSLVEKKIKSKVVYDGKILKLEVDDVTLPDGTYSQRECVRHSGGAAVLFVKDGNVALVRQYRYLYGKEIYEIPAGKLNDGENPQAGAKRELEEETGYRADKLVHLGDIYPSPGYTDEIIYLYFAPTAIYCGQKLDVGEFLNCMFMPLDKVIEMIADGEITDAKTVTAVYKYLLDKNNIAQA
jgi:ADP-ribose pyrophosphatase